MNEMYLQGFIDKCAQVGVDPEALVKAAEEVEPEALVEAVKNVKATDKPLLDSAVYDYLAQLLPGVGALTLGGVRAHGRDENVLGGAVEGLGGNLLGYGAGGLGGAVAGGTAGNLLGRAVTKLHKAFSLLDADQIENSLETTTDPEEAAKLIKKLKKTHRSIRRARSAIPAFGTALMTPAGAILGLLAGGAHGLRYFTRKPKKNSDE